MEPMAPHQAQPGSADTRCVAGHTVSVGERALSVVHQDRCGFSFEASGITLAEVVAQDIRVDWVATDSAKCASHFPAHEGRVRAALP